MKHPILAYPSSWEEVCIWLRRFEVRDFPYMIAKGLSADIRIFGVNAEYVARQFENDGVAPPDMVGVDEMGDAAVAWGVFPSAFHGQGEFGTPYYTLLIDETAGFRGFARAWIFPDPTVHRRSTATGAWHGVHGIDGALVTGNGPPIMEGNPNNFKGSMRFRRLIDSVQSTRTTWSERAEELRSTQIPASQKIP